jgi:hypothetical protein
MAKKVIMQDENTTKRPWGSGVMVKRDAIITIHKMTRPWEDHK